MKKSRFREEQILGILKQAEAGRRTEDLCREHGISPATFYTWRSKYGGLEGERGQTPESARGRERPAEGSGGGAIAR